MKAPSARSHRSSRGWAPQGEVPAGRLGERPDALGVGRDFGVALRMGDHVTPAATSLVTQLLIPGGHPRYGNSSCRQAIIRLDVRIGAAGDPGRR
jgi:hypothetical protein